jgi:hypothetical protein
MTQTSILTRSVLLVSLILFGSSLVRVESSAHGQVLKWEIEATVIEIDDPDMIFTEVRLGDPVRGFISYDLTTPPDDDDPNDILYIHDPAFEVTGMVIENPRDGSEIEFIADREIIADIEVVDDLEDDDLGLFDNVSAYQSVLSPDGFSGPAPTVVVDLYGPPDVLADTSLPVELDLDDWPDATIYFVDFIDLFFGLEEPPSYVYAEIHTLTPADIPSLPGDFNADRAVDAADYVVWRHGLGATHTQADYDAWRANFGRSSGRAAATPAADGGLINRAVPEPATWFLFVSALIFARRRWSTPKPRVGRRDRTLANNQYQRTVTPEALYHV